jgi:hypothetical protein
MEELRSEIRAAFDKEQAAHPPAGALRRDVSTAVAAQPRPASNLQWLAVAAAILLGFAVVAGLMSSRLAHHAPVPANPKGDYGPPPAGIPLLYVQDSNNPSWLVGYDWSGKARGTVKLAAPVDPIGHAAPAIQQQPDGSGFVVGFNPKDGNATYLDRLGRPIVGNPQPECVVRVDRQTFVWTLSTKLPNQAERQVAVIARDKGIGQTGISVGACSFQTDKTVLVRTTISWPSEIWVLRLSDGKVLSHHTYTAGTLTDVVTSRDAAYISENFNDSNAVSRIRRESDRLVISPAANAYWVRMYSGDGSLVLTSDGPDNPILPSRLKILDWRSNQVVWTYTGPDTIRSFIAQPGGRDFALAFMRHDLLVPASPCVDITDGPQCVVTEDGLRDVVIAHGDGSSNSIQGRFKTIW